MSRCDKDSKNRVRSIDDELTTRDICQILASKPVHRTIALDCNCPSYIARPKLRFKFRFELLLLCALFRLIAIILYSTAQNVDDSERQMAELCGFSFIALVLSFIIDYYHYWVWWHYRPSCDDRYHCTLSKKHKRYISYHLMGYNRSMPVSDEPCPNSYECTNCRLEHLMIFHLCDHKPQQRNSAVKNLAKPEDTIYIGFHQTSPEFAIAIAHSDFRPSMEGKQMLGYGIYFARSKAGTENKARQN
ncbi:unnamed protein product, partial [Didymodactylos carnosus]